MSNYTQNVFYGPKDALTTGDPNKKIRGTEIDAELSEISTAISSKEDTANKGQPSGYAGLGADSLVPNANLPDASETVEGIVELATTAEAAAGTDTLRAVTSAGVEAWGAQNAGIIQDLSNLASPGFDRLLFWDHSALAAVFMSFGTGLTSNGTVLDLTGPIGAISALTAGIIAVTSASTVAQRSIAAGTGGITVTNGDGVAGNPTVNLASVAETLITDGSILARVAGNETISGSWTFSSRPDFTGQGGFLNNASASNTGGDVTLSATVPTTAAQVGGVGDWRLVYS